MIELLDPIIKSHNVEISNGLNVHYLEANFKQISKTNSSSSAWISRIKF